MRTCASESVNFEQLAKLGVGDQFEISIKYHVEVSVIDGLLKLIDSNLFSSPDLDKLRLYILNNHCWLLGQSRTLRLDVQDSDFGRNWVLARDVLGNSLNGLEVVRTV